MSVETVLSKITTHNSDVLGCIATHGDNVHHNLPDLYELVDTDAVTEYAANMFTATDALETDQTPFDQLFLEYGGHSVYAKRLDDGVLVLLNKPIEKANFKRMQVGVNLFIKPLKRALAASGTAPIKTLAPQSLTVPPPTIPEPPKADVAAQDNAEKKPRKRRWF